MSSSGWESSKKYPLNAGVPQGFIYDTILAPFLVNDLPDDAICDIAGFNLAFQKWFLSFSNENNCLGNKEKFSI